MSTSLNFSLLFKPLPYSPWIFESFLNLLVQWSTLTSQTWELNGNLHHPIVCLLFIFRVFVTYDILLANTVLFGSPLSNSLTKHLMYYFIIGYFVCMCCSWPIVSSPAVSIELSASAPWSWLLQDHPVHLLHGGWNGRYHAGTRPSALLHPGIFPHH